MDCDCKDEHEGEHPRCPKCHTDETRRTRNFGKPVGNEWWCLKCHHRWEPLRTKFIDFDANTRSPKSNFYCIACQRDIKPDEKHRRVLTVSGEPFAVHPEDHAKVPAASAAWHFIGMSCARKLGLTWTLPPEVSNEPVVLTPTSGPMSAEAAELLSKARKASEDANK